MDATLWAKAPHGARSVIVEREFQKLTLRCRGDSIPAFSRLHTVGPGDHVEASEAFKETTTQTGL
jgi:hypothetical protein